MGSKDDTDASIKVDPNERLRLLTRYSNEFEVDFHIPPTKYYRSGIEMVRQATVYYREGSLENAYVLYLKFMTLFLEKIRTHPEFNTVPARLKSDIQKQLREILPVAEKLRSELLQQYQDEYNRYVAELKEKSKIENEIKSLTSSATSTKTTNFTRSSLPTTTKYVDVKIPQSIDNVNYPDPNLSILVQRQQPSPQPQPSPAFKDCEKLATPRPPLFDRNSKPSNFYNFKSNQLRLVNTPAKLVDLFQAIAQKNTMRNIETCGILAGKLQKDELIVTHLIIPKQKGTSDSCTTMNEEEIFDYQDQWNLITIGWIHTHPTQTAFLSSVDLHTHCPYQLLMPEAVAIVCAPRYNDNQCFILTPDYGLNFIANCRQTGFHPHPTEPPLFKIAEHVKITKDAPLEILDLRT